MSYGDYGLPNWDYFNMYCELSGSGSLSTPPSFTPYASISNEIMKFNDGGLGLEMRVDRLSSLLKQGASNYFYVSEYNSSTGTNFWYDRYIKFLPEMP
jgi:hypothetical protein